MARPYPWYYAVNDRPVMIVLLPDGGSDALVFDWATGAFVPDRSYFGRVSDVGIGKDVDSLTKQEFDARVGELRRSISLRRQATPIAWERTGDGEYPYRFVLEGRVLTIRVNDFPAEPLYTLIVDGVDAEHLDDWPAAWVRPPIPLA